MKKIVTVLALLSLVMTSRAGITGSYDYATKTLTVNYVYVADPYDANNDGINPSDLNYLNLNAGMVDRIVLTGEWKNKNMQKAGELVIKYASRQDPVELDLSACKGLVSKFKSVTDYINVQDFDNTTTTFSYEPMWGETFNLDKAREEDRLSGIVFPANSSNFTYIPGELVCNSNNLKKVVVSEGIVAIGNKAFSGSKIENLVLGSTVTEIGCGAFINANIKALDLAKLKLSRIRQQTFQDCRKLASVTFPTTITQIQAEAFQRTPIVKADLSQCHDLTLLAYQCFSECTSLDSVIICTHEKVIRGANQISNDGTAAGGGAFYNARNIKVVEIKYCNGTDVTKCWCENAAFDYDVTHVQTRLDRIPEACKLIYPKGDNASAPYKSNYDFFVGDYKTGAVIRQSHLLKFWRYIPARGQNVAELPEWLDKSNLNNYKGNGWLEFLSTGDGEVIEEGDFLRTYSRTAGTGPVLLNYNLTAYRAIDYVSTAWDFVKDKNGEWVLINENDPSEGYRLKDGEDAGKTTYARLTIGGQLLLRPLHPLDKNGNEVTGISYIPENTGVVLHSKALDEDAFLLLEAYEGDKYDLSVEYPHTGDRFEASRFSWEDDDINMLEGSYGDDCPVAPVYPWVYSDEENYTGGHYTSNKEYRNFGFNKSSMRWIRLLPGLLRLNRAYAHIPIIRFNNFNETTDQMPDFTLEDHVTEPTDNRVVLSTLFEDETDGIEVTNFTKQSTDKDAWYTLQGVKVEKPIRGAYIHNNKVVVIK